eukprot:scaffold370475_cov20-Prasinocladus_malaysianus.AAC.1
MGNVLLIEAIKRRDMHPFPSATYIRRTNRLVIRKRRSGGVNAIFHPPVRACNMVTMGWLCTSSGAILGAS